MSKNTITGLFAVVTGLFYLFLALRLPHVNMGDPLGPKVFPLLIGTVVVVLGLMLLIKERFVSPDKSETVSFKMTPEVKTLIFRIGLTSVFGIIYGFMLDPLGYLLSTLLFMLLLMYVVNKLERKLESFITAVSFSLVTYVAFGILLKLSLPRGIFYF